jgi:hypothetical protein
MDPIFLCAFYFKFNIKFKFFFWKKKCKVSANLARKKEKGDDRCLYIYAKTSGNIALFGHLRYLWLLLPIPLTSYSTCDEDEIHFIF